MKAQMKAAYRSGARFAIIIATDELEGKEVTLRDLRGDGSQERVSRSNLVNALAASLKERYSQ